MKQTVIITGATRGLGYETARQLLQQPDWFVLIASRNVENNRAAVDKLRLEAGTNQVTALQLDLGSLASVERFVDMFLAMDLPPLHAIVCNAGLSLTHDAYTDDGFEMTFGVNHLGHFLLVSLLLPHLREPGRVINVSSGTHIPEHKLARMMGVPSPKYVVAEALAYPNNATVEARITNPSQRYSTSKLCNVLFTYSLARCLEKQGRAINVYTLDPGLMPGTGLVRGFPEWVQQAFAGVISSVEPMVAGIRRPEDSGSHLARLVTDPALVDVRTAYFDGLKPVPSSTDSYDETKQRDLWETSERLIETLRSKSPQAV